MNERNLCGMTVEAIFDKYCNTVYRLAFSRTQNKYDAEDILQSVFLHLCRCDAVFNDDEHIKAWLLKVTVNTSKNLLSSAFRRLSQPMTDQFLAEDNPSFEVYDVVRTLPEKYRTVVHLFYYEGYTCAEIARILGTKEATVKTRLKRSRERLSTLLKGENFDV